MVESIRLSWSRYNSYKSCKLQYDLKYRQRIKMPKLRTPFIVGSTVHNLVEKWAESGYGETYIKESIVVAFNKEYGNTKLTVEARAKMLRKAIRGALLTEQVYRSLKLPEHHAVIESWFTLDFPDSNDKLIGGLDVYDPVVSTIYDLKMYSINSVADPEQLLTYAVAQRIQGIPVEHMGIITPFLTTKYAIVDVSEADIDAHMEVLRDAINGMKGEINSQPTTGSHCHWCDYKGKPACPATYTGTDVMAVRVKPRRLSRIRRPRGRSKF